VRNYEIFGKKLETSGSTAIGFSLFLVVTVPGIQFTCGEHYFLRRFWKNNEWASL